MSTHNRRSRSTSPPRRRRRWKPIKSRTFHTDRPVRRGRIRPTEEKEYNEIILGQLQRYNQPIADPNMIREISQFHKCMYYEGLNNYKLYTGGTCSREITDLLEILFRGRAKWLVYDNKWVKIYQKQFASPLLTIHLPDPDNPGGYYYLTAELTRVFFDLYNSKTNDSTLVGVIYIRHLIEKSVLCTISGSVWKDKRSISKRSKKGMPNGLNPAEYCFILLPDNKSIIARYTYVTDPQWDYPDDMHPRYERDRPVPVGGIAFDDVILYTISININNKRF